MVKRIVKITAIFLMVFLCLTGCFSAEYKGENPELYTVAVYNFLGRSGYGSNGEIAFSSEAEILETDSYGRVLFYYHEGVIEYGCGYGILQKSLDGYVYFYEDDCVIPANDDWNGSGQVTHDEWFTQNQILNFKTRNDWEQPFNEEKCTKKLVVNEKPTSKLKPKKADFDRVAKEYYESNGIPYSTRSVHTSDEFFMADDYGREIHVLWSYIRGVSSDKVDYDLIILFNPDGSCDSSKAIAEITDFLNYREFIKEFKLRNGWNTEYKIENA